MHTTFHYCLAACLSAPLLLQPVLAQVPTDKGPLRLVVGYQAGGSADIQARALAEPLSQRLGIPVIVENRSGAGGQIAVEHVRQAPPDGLTVLFANTHMMVMLPLTTASVRYDPLADFQSVGRVVSFHEAIAVPANSPAQDVAGWIAAARADERFGTYGVPAAGSLAQFIGYRLGADHGATFLAAPYRGATPAIQDLLGGQLQATITPISDLRAHTDSGRVRALAVNGGTRSSLLPNTPTLAELGYAGFENLEWTGLMVGAKVPAATVEQLNAALNDALAQPEVVARFEALSSPPAPSTPAQLHELIASDLVTWRPVVEASGFSAD